MPIIVDTIIPFKQLTEQWKGKRELEKVHTLHTDKNNSPALWINLSILLPAVIRLEAITI